MNLTKGQSKSTLLRLFSHLVSVASTGTGLAQHNTSGTNTTRYASKESPQVWSLTQIIHFHYFFSLYHVPCVNVKFNAWCRPCSSLLLFRKWQEKVCVSELNLVPIDCSLSLMRSGSAPAFSTSVGRAEGAPIQTNNLGVNNNLGTNQGIYDPQVWLHIRSIYVWDIYGLH